MSCEQRRDGKATGDHLYLKLEQFMRIVKDNVRILVEEEDEEFLATLQPNLDFVKGLIRREVIDAAGKVTKGAGLLL